MLRKSKKFLTVILTLSVAASLMAGCKKAPAADTAPVDTTQNASYPIKTDVTLKYFLNWWPNPASLGVKSYNETKFAAQLYKETGIKVEFVSPTSNDQFNLMLASGDLPDIIEYPWFNFPGGPEKAIADNDIIKLNDTLTKYAPNLTKYLKSNPEVDKMAKTDSGSYYVFPFVRGDKSLQVFQGGIIRKDWLDDLGLQMPKTIDDWTNVLKQFKDKKNVIPFSTEIGTFNSSNIFAGAYGVGTGLYNDNGKVKYGRSEAGYKDYLTLLRKWYADGLLDKNFATLDGKTKDANMTGSKVGATVGNTGGGIGKWQPLVAKNDPKANLVPAPYPTLKAGDKVKFAQWDLPYMPDGSAAITSKCKNVEIAARLLDYGYSEKGQILYNFGIEGESYKMDNGVPKYTDLITKNPDGKPMTDMLAMYVRGGYYGPTVQNKGYMEQYAALPAQQDSLKVWADTDAVKTTLPRLTLTPEESKEAATIQNDINTYANEMFLKFIMGSESLDNYDKYTAQLTKLKLPRLLELYQGAMDRYSKR